MASPCAWKVLLPLQRACQGGLQMKLLVPMEMSKASPPHRQGSLHMGCLFNRPFSFILTRRPGVCSWQQGPSSRI